MSSALNTFMSHISPRKRPITAVYSSDQPHTDLSTSSSTGLMSGQSTSSAYSALQRAFAYSSTTPSCTTAKKRTVKGSHSWIIRGFTDLPLVDKPSVDTGLVGQVAGATAAAAATDASAVTKIKPFVHSQEFEIGGYKWKMELWPNGDTVTSGDSEGWITLYLCCCTPLRENQELRRRAEFRFLNWCNPECDMVCSLGWATYSAAQPAWGRRKALQRTELINNSQWLRNDELILVCEVEVDLGVQIEHVNATAAMYDTVCDRDKFSKVAKDYMSMLCEESGQDVTLVCESATTAQAKAHKTDITNSTTDQPRSLTPNIPQSKKRRVTQPLSDDDASDDSVVGLDAPSVSSGNEVRAHKAVLMSRSKVFGAMFRNECIEKTAQTVTLHGINVQTLKQLLQYIYTGALAVSNLCTGQLDSAQFAYTDDARQPTQPSTDTSTSSASPPPVYVVDGIGCNAGILNEVNSQFAHPIKSWQSALQLYDAAVYYDVPDCAIDCARLVGKALTVENAPQTLQFVLQHANAPGIDLIKSYLKPFTQ